MTDSRLYDHDPIEEIQPDVFMVRGCIKLNALMTIARNMAIVRHAGELTLVDPIRLSAAEEKRLGVLECDGTVCGDGVTGVVCGSHFRSVASAFLIPQTLSPQAGVVRKNGGLP